MPKRRRSDNNAPLVPSGGKLQEDIRASNRKRREGLRRLADARGKFGPGRNDLLPDLELVDIAIAELRTGPRPVRKKDSAHIQEVANSIVTFGAVNPILVGRDNVIIDGEVTVEAAKLVGLHRIPSIRVGHLTENQQRLLRLTLNRLGEKGAWDIAELKYELNELILSDEPIEISGFSLGEIDEITSSDFDKGHEKGPLAPEAGATPIAQPGDEYQLGAHRVICGDATNPAVLSRLMRGHPKARFKLQTALNSPRTAVARLVLTDEPYNVPIVGNVTRGRHREFAMASGEMSAATYLDFNEAWMAAALPHLVNGGTFGTFIDWRGYTVVAAAAVNLGLYPLNLVVWGKSNAGMGSLYRSQHELLPLFKKGDAAHVNNIKLGKHGRWRSNLWTYPGASSLGSDARRGLAEHPTVKPTAMLEDALRDLTDRGDIVLDPFLGSGSTLIAAERTGRVCRGLEIDPLYVDLIIRRFETETEVEAILTETGETHAQVATRRAQALKPSDDAPRARRRGRKEDSPTS